MRISSRAWEIGMPTVLGLLAALLLLANLGNTYLWQDEAQTALIAQTVLTSGVPRGTDGVNFFSQELGAEYGPNFVWRWHTWLPFYLVAVFFGLFGVGTLTARLPFALFGIGTVLLAYVFARGFLRSRRAGFTAALLLATSVPFLLLSRQCRYYSLAAFFSLLGLHAYRRLVEGQAGRRVGVLFVAGAVLLFHTFYVYYVALCAAVLADAVLLHRGVLKRVGVLLAVTVALNAPWIAWLAAMPYGEHYSVLGLQRAGTLALSFLVQLGTYVVPWLLLAVPVILGIVRLVLAVRKHFRKSADGVENAEKVARVEVEVEKEAESTPRRSVLLFLYLGANLAILSLSAPAPFFRYLAPLLPICCVLAAWIVESVMRKQVVVGWLLVAGVLFLQPLRAYAYELTHDFDGPMEGIVGYLNRHGKPGEVVAIPYEDLPVKFYTKMRVVGGLTGEDLSVAKQATWVILRKHVLSGKDRRVQEYLVENLPRENYEAIKIDYPDTIFENRESPQEHRFRTDRDEDRVVIYRRIAP